MEMNSLNFSLKKQQIVSSLNSVPVIIDDFTSEQKRSLANLNPLLNIAKVDLRQEYNLRRLRENRKSNLPKEFQVSNVKVNYPVLDKTKSKNQAITSSQDIQVDDNDSLSNRGDITNNIPVDTFGSNNSKQPDFNTTSKTGNIIREYTEMDLCALNLGRLVLKTVLRKPEVSVSDALSRFFFDTWLEKFGSSLSQADSMTIELLAILQKSIADITTKMAIEEESTIFDKGTLSAHSISSYGDAYLRESKISKALCGLGMEAYDSILSAFDSTNPVLHEIKRAILPAIFSEFPFTDAFEGRDLLHIERLFKDADLSAFDIPERSITVPSRFQGNLDSLISINDEDDDDAPTDKFIHLKSKGLTGKKYTRFKTWHECFCELKEKLKQQSLKVGEFFRERNSLYEKIELQTDEIEEKTLLIEELLNEKNLLETKNLELNELLESKNADIYELEQNSSKMQIIIEDFKMKNAKLSNKLHHANEYVNHVKQQMEDLQSNAIPDLREEYAKVCTDRDSQESYIKQLEQQLQQATFYTDVIKNQQVESKQDLFEISAKMKKLFSEMPRYHAVVSS